MWLLSTDRAELKFFPSPDAVLGGYAILSHRWGAVEETFQSVQEIVGRCSLDGSNPRDLVGHKVRECCTLAERHGFRWVWIDSCCIDKTSGSELSEAINSMFKWYSQAEICYAFLEDVPSTDCDLFAPDSEFRSSRWHTRGWTLQELIAPATVMFLSRDWGVLGMKADPRIAALLESITWIPSEVFTRKTYFFHYSIAVRMRWASRRTTTRMEDEAYSLLGLFQVNIPIVYGDGRGAFQRLQEEIMRNSHDSSMFAWQMGMTLDSNSVTSQDTIRGSFPVGSQNYHKHLLAPSPTCFQCDAHYTPLLPKPLQKYPLDKEAPNSAPLESTMDLFGEGDLPEFSMTSYGVRCRFPIFEAGGFTVAVLLCETSDSHLGLLLHPDLGAPDRFKPRYFTGYSFAQSSGNRAHSTVKRRSKRLVKLGNDLTHLRFDGEVVRARWRTIYIVPRPSDSASPDTLLIRVRYNCGPRPPFRVPQWLISTLITLGWKFIEELDHDPQSITMRFFNPFTSEVIAVDMGMCRQRAAQSRAPTESHWARVRAYKEDALDAFSVHQCSEHHVDVWPQLAKDFGDSSRRVRLSVSPCRIRPETTRVIHLELLGPVYQGLLRSTGIVIPPRDSLLLGTV